MGCHHLTPSALTASDNFNRFIQGDEQGLTGIYRHLSNPIRRYGLRMVHDEFVVNTIVQEAFLKLWAFRERMTDMDHIARFLKLTMRWECMAYYRHPMETLYRNALRLSWMETWDVASPPPEHDIVQTENRLHLVRSMIPRLPGNRQRTIVSLYAKDGLTIKQIARRLQTTTQAITLELYQGLDLLRALLLGPEKKGAAPPSPPGAAITLIAGLSKEQSHIVTMRRNMKYTFGQIAGLLKLPQPYVQKQYVEAWKKCSGARV
jgi:RNA polymerase sigma factor (sigma-70 family)